MKRNLAVLHIEDTYVIIETVENGDVYVQFIPHSWLVALKKNATIKPKDLAKFYFPCRLASQSKFKYLKYTKQAKFLCTPPEMNAKWELRDCRVLKMDLGT